MVTKPSAEKLEEEVKLRQCLLNHAALQQGCQLVYDFQHMVHKRDRDNLTSWLQACQASKIPEFVNLALGMKKDHEAIQTALSSEWSNGQTEGQVNRLKLLKGKCMAVLIVTYLPRASFIHHDTARKLRKTH